jgi:two-component system sensor histidine kinase KdpD
VPLDDELSLALRGRVLPAEDQRVLGAFASQVAVAYRQRQLMEAAEAAVPLAESDRMRTALLNAVSHDLRTPLATAKAALSGLSDKNITWSPEDEQELLTTAGSALDRLTDLVTNLLDLSRLQAGVLSVFPRSVGLDDVVSAALAHVAGDHTIDLDVPASLPEVLADPGLLERVVANLVQNAVRHSPPQAAGRVAGSYHDGRVELRVIDRGPGIPAAAQGQVFEPFQRLHDHATSEDAGVGLGLAIARGFAEAMAGDLVIEDTPGGPDHGRRHARLASPGAVLTRVLVVDDEPQMLRALHLNLTARGYDVVTAEDGTSALNEVAISEPDVIVLDLGLPDIDGLEVIRAIRTGSQVPILVLSARIGSSDKVAALDLGADDFVTKPFDMNELLARLRAATRRTAPEQSRRGQVQFGGTEVDLEAKTAARDGASVHLTPTEWHLLELLLRNPGKLITQRHLLTALRGQPDHTDPSYLRIYMAQLRKKLEAEPGRPKHLLTEPGMGYRFHV